MDAVRGIFRSLPTVGALLAVGNLAAGEILILQPVPAATERNQAASRQLDDQARRQAGQSVADPAYVLDPAGAILLPAPVAPSERLRHEAGGYLDREASGAMEGGVPVLRAAPLSDVERARMKARSYVAEPVKGAARRCDRVSNQVGTIGEGSDAQRSENAVERGGSAINPDCR